MKILRVDHIGINVEDLAAAKEFFVDLGFKVMGEMTMQGELVERVIGLADVKDDIVMLTSPDGQINIELVKYWQPKDPKGVQALPANTIGLRHLCFQVEDLDGILENLQQKGTKLVGEVQTYENSWKFCFRPRIGRYNHRTSQST
jgi:catechol 2,3-dioxygenase-like lactoylglutathione lyase family enzyme